MIREVNTDACTTTYDVDGVKVKVSVISGGTIAATVGDHDYSRNFGPADPKWNKKMLEHRGSDGTIKYHYPHQDPQNIRGPTFDDIPGGAEALQNLVDGVATKLALRKKRQSALSHYNNIRSRYFYADPGSESRMWLVIESGRHDALPQVSAMGGPSRYSRREQIPVPDAAWGTLVRTLEELRGENGVSVEDIGEADYWRLIAALDAAAARGI